MANDFPYEAPRSLEAAYEQAYRKRDAHLRGEVRHLRKMVTALLLAAPNRTIEVPMTITKSLDGPGEVDRWGIRVVTSQTKMACVYWIELHDGEQPRAGEAEPTRGRPGTMSETTPPIYDLGLPKTPRLRPPTDPHDAVARTRPRAIMRAVRDTRRHG